MVASCSISNFRRRTTSANNNLLEEVPLYRAASTVELSVNRYYTKAPFKFPRLASSSKAQTTFSNSRKFDDFPSSSGPQVPMR
jgi:hypothetical protein